MFLYGICVYQSCSPISNKITGVTEFISSNQLKPEIYLTIYSLNKNILKNSFFWIYLFWSIKVWNEVWKVSDNNKYTETNSFLYHLKEFFCNIFRVNNWKSKVSNKV